MKIGIDARLYGFQNKGIGRYIQKLIEYLERIDQKNQYVIFLVKKNWEDYQPKNSNFKKVLADYKTYGLKEQIFMPLKIWQERLDIIHFPHFNVPICVKNFIVTIHDLATTRFSNLKATTLNFFLYKIKHLAYRLIIWLAIKRAKKIITVSEFSKKEIIKYFKIKPEKITVTYEAADRFLITEQSKIYIPKPYLLYVGAAYPHKNLENLLKAFRILLNDLKSSDTQNLKLVLVGKEDFFYQRLKKKTEELSLRERTIFLGYLDDQGLVQIYQNAFIYVFPSYYEGFGLPALEALSQGVPVVASRTGSLPEILDQAALYFNPHDIKDMAQIIGKVINDKNLREDLIKKGFKQVKKFNWQKCAEETLKVYTTR